MAMEPGVHGSAGMIWKYGTTWHNTGGEAVECSDALS